MLRLIAILCLCLPVVPLRLAAAAPAPLEEAISKWVADEDHWAYTQRLHARGIRPVPERVERYDPSQPDDKQWELLEIGGKKPTPEQLASWRRSKDRELKRRHERPLADYFDFERATVAEETADFIRYNVPLFKGTYRRVPVERLDVTITVSKPRHDLLGLTAGLKQTFRVAMGTTKVTDFGLDLRFRVIDENFASQPDLIKVSGNARVALFFKVGGDGEVTWSDFRRVKPYNERFDVKIGELKALDF